MTLVEARRFLHACYCCDDADAVARFLDEALALRVAMRTRGGRRDGAILGFDGEIETEAVFVYDARGPRTSPALEVQRWIDPAPVGRPYAEPHHVGIQAFGVAVRDLEATLERLAPLGGQSIGRPQRAGELLGGRAASVRDRLGIGVDLVEVADLADAETRLHHLRLTCSDLDRSVEWYAGLGFELLERSEPIAVARALLGSTAGTVRAARMRLPDEPLSLVLHQWLDPRATGRPYDEPNHVGLYRVAIGVDDTREAVRRLERASVAIERQPLLVGLAGTKVPDMWIAFLRDPDGVPVELVERPRSAFR